MKNLYDKFIQPKDNVINPTTEQRLLNYILTYIPGIPYINIIHSLYFVLYLMKKSETTMENQKILLFENIKELISLKKTQSY